jgi:hypothetical protein
MIRIKINFLRILFINNKNKDKFFKDFNDNLKDKKRDFNDNFNNITVSLFTGIENNISICYKFQNDFNDYFQDKNNKNINDYKSIYTNNDDKDKYFIYFSNFIMIDKGNFLRILITFVKIKMKILIINFVINL